MLRYLNHRLLAAVQSHAEVEHNGSSRVSDFKAFLVTSVGSSKGCALVQGLKSLCSSLILNVSLFVKTSYCLD